MRWREWVLTVAVSWLAGAAAAKLHTRWTQPEANCANVSCAYLQARLGVIRQSMAARPDGPVYLVIGDSLTEFGRWPDLCGHRPVPAGIGGARSDTWLPHARSIAEAVKPALVVLALGTNDLLTLKALGPYEELVASLAGFRLVAIPVHGMPGISRDAAQAANARIARAVPRTAEPISAATTDGVHLTGEDYRRWLAALERIICAG